MSSDPVLTGAGAGPRLLFNALLAVALVLIYAPAVYLLLASFNSGMQLGLVPPDEFSLTWYVALADERRLITALVESVIVGAATALVATPIGLSAALAFRAMARRRGAFFLFVLFAMFVPGTIQGLKPVGDVQGARGEAVVVHHRRLACALGAALRLHRLPGQPRGGAAEHDCGGPRPRRRRLARVPRRHPATGQDRHRLGRGVLLSSSHSTNIRAPSSSSGAPTRCRSTCSEP